MNNEYKKIEDLIERFFDGTTSNEEEKRLYDFFAQDAIPDHLQKYKPIFEYFDKGVAEDTKETVNQKQVSMNLPQRKKYSLYMIAGVAASVLILLSVYFLSGSGAKQFDPYEGSYIVRNGVRITDMDEIRSELEKTYRDAIYQEEVAEKMIQDASSSRNKYNDTELKLREQYDNLMNQVVDEAAKKEIREMFESI